jgi:alkylation response protein AidB-like acyl-CoA dehydrogenase
VASGDGPRLALLPLDAAGIARTDGIATHGEAVADLVLEGVALPRDHVLESAEATAWLDLHVSLCVAALQLGVTAEALRRTAAYVGERHQFGRPIGSFQAVATRMADAYAEVELLRGAVWRLAWLLDAGRPADAAARIAKWQAAQAGHIVGHTAQHYHGGIGADLTYPIHRFFLWARALELTGGGAEVQLARLGAALAEIETE